MLPILLLGDKMDIKYCYITDEYYKDHPDLLFGSEILVKISCNSSYVMI